MYFTFCFSVWWHSLLDLHKWKNQLDNRNARVKRYIINILFSSVCICDSRIATQRHLRRSVLSAEPSPLRTHTHTQAFNCALPMSVCTRLHGEPLVVKALAHPSLIGVKRGSSHGSGKPTWSHPEQPIGSRSRPLGRTEKERQPLMGS